MAYDPMAGFKIGQEIGKSKGSAYGKTSQHMSDLAMQRDKESGSIEKPLQLAMLKQAIQPATGVYSWNPTTGQLDQQASVPKGSIVRNTTTEEDITNKKVAEKSVTGAGAEAGKMAFIKTALREGLPGARSILFPTGDTKNFNRKAAVNSTLFNGAPIPFNKDAQNLYRQLGSALAARRYMITGQATNQGEQKELVNQFMSQWGSDPEALSQGISQIENEFNEYLRIADPSSIFHEDNPASQSGQPQVNDSQTAKDRLRNKLMQRGLL